MDYLQDIQRSLDYIEQNLHERITVERIARRFLCSEFYFHRIFRAATGYSVAEYLRWRRLTRAAEMLAGTDEKIAGICEKLGFDSQSAFTRAFKNAFGATPLQYRREQSGAELCCRVDLEGRSFPDKYYGVTLGPRLVLLPEKRTVGLAVGGTYAQFRREALTPRLWSDFLRRTGEVEGAVSTHIYGVLRRNGAAGGYTYHVGIEARDGERLPPGMSANLLPESLCVVFTHRFLPTLRPDENRENIPRTHGYIFNRWLPGSGYVRRGDIFLMERLGKENGGMDMLVPVERRAGTAVEFSGGVV